MASSLGDDAVWRRRTTTVAGVLALAASIVLGVGCGSDTSKPIDLNEGDAGFEGTPDTGADAGFDSGSEPDVANGDEDAGGYVVPDFAFPPLPVDVDTTVVSPVRVGEALTVTCRLFDARGDVVEPDEAPEFTYAVSPDGSFDRQGRDWIPTRAGTATVRCAAPSLGLVDLEPAEIEILPGEPVSSTITAEPDQIVAGETVTATCNYFDVYGNEVDPADDGLEQSLTVTPAGGGVDVTGLTATITTADVYTMSCFVPGLTHEQTTLVEVVPGPPANLVVAAAPNQQVYGLGQVVTLAYFVTDEYGNLIPDASVSMDVDATTGWASFGSGRFRFDEEGTYQVTVTVDDSTTSGASLTQTVTIVVNGEGPAIACEEPLDGTMIDGVPGQPITVRGSVNDANGIQSLLVNGQGVTVNADGTFEAPVNPDWGINFVEVVATDQFGEQNSRTCTFLLSNHWSDETSFMDDSVVLRLAQAAIDDGNPSDLDSLNDLLHTVVNSQGLVDEVDDALEAANPLQPWTCESESCFLGVCVCWLGYGVNYTGDIRVDGPNTTELDLVTGGIDAHARIEDLGVRVQVPYTIAEIDGSTTGWVTTDFIDVRMTIDLALVNNRPRASIRPGSVDVSVGQISTSFDGLDGTIVNFVIDLFNDQVRGLIADTLQGFIEDSFDDVIDGVVSSLDIDTLGTAFDVPRLDGSGTVGVQFNLQFSRLATSSSRFAVGIGTRFRPTVTRNGSPSFGIPRAQNSVWLEPSSSRPVLVAVYVGVLNHVLHALWRGGLFDATVAGSDLGGGLPEGASAVLQTSLPPVVENRDDGTVELSLGGMSAAVTYPGIFDDPLHVTLGARATASVSVSGDELNFGAITIEELAFSTTDVSLDPTTRTVLEGLLQRLVQSVVDTSLNQSLPALPIPAFTIPPSVAQYGLPANAELGIRNPALDVTTHHYELEGNFGVR